MKKILVAMVAAGLVSVPFMASAKIGGKISKPKFAQKGTLTIGSYAIGGPNAVNAGLIGFNNVNNDDADDAAKVTTFGLAPAVSYFVIDGLEIELGLAYASAGSDNVTNSNWALAPAVRYSLSALKKYAMFPYFNIGFAYGSATSETEMSDGMGTTTTTEVTNSMTDLSFGAGITQALGSAQGGFASLGLNYHMMTVTPDADGAEDVKYSGLQIGVKFGLYLN
ncbi:MAG: outer membrane beta-barrel protein [Myxococcota bacterium]|nr:outer membrane beta-barrel protein [Myxococcota bacterium]